MKTIKKTIKKILLISVIFLEIILLSAQPTYAGLFGGGGFPKINVNDIMKQIENRYHINQGSVQDFAEGFNVSEQKVIAPEVKITFSPAKPRLGEEITATALPTGFQDGENDLYFNWYLKHADCNETNSPSAAQRRLCDADGDGQIEPNDWKVEAMRIIATNGFDRTKANYGGDSDNDGYSTVKGGNNNIQNDYCYVHDFISGTDYEVATVGNAGGGSSVACGGTLVCGVNDTASCLNSSLTLGTGTIGTLDYAVINNSGEAPYCDPNISRITCPNGTIPMCVNNTQYLDPTCEFIATGADPTLLATASNAATDIACTTDVGTASAVSGRCEHQFANGHGTIGDGSFGLQEEIFWGTDSNNPNTAGTGNLDEANLAGLAVNTLTWDYLPGDEVGVIVEGSSFIGTKHDDSSKQITFALPKNIFDGHGDCRLEDKSRYVQTIRGYPVDIPVARINIDNCLEYNLVDPSNSDFASVLDTELSYYPNNPNVGGVGINGDSSGGDVLTVSANTSNLSGSDSEVYYKWSIYGTTRSRDNISLLDGSADGWQELSSSAAFRENNGIGVLEGLGMSEFKLQLNSIPAGITFLRFYAEVEEFYGRDSSGSSGKASSGRDNIIVQINNSSSNNGIDLSIGATNICTAGSGTCEVLNNQIVTARLRNGANIRNYLWTLNGKQINYLTGADVSQGDEIRFLVQGDLGETFILNLIANDTAKTNAGGANDGEKINLTRNLVIVKPMVALGPNNELNRDDIAATGCQSLSGGSTSLGSYSTTGVGAGGGLETQTVPDCNETVFDATGSVTLNPTYYPRFIAAEILPENVVYYVNGVDQGSNSTVDLGDYLEGAFVTVTIEASYAPNAGNVGPLAADWGVSQLESSTPYKMSDTILIRVGGTTGAMNKTSKVIAGLAYNLPQEMIFVFRIMLTALVIVFTSGVLMSLSKKRYNN